MFGPVDAHGSHGGFGAALVAQHAALCLGDGQRSVGKSGAAFAQGGKVLQHGADARFPAFPIEKGFMVSGSTLVPLF